MHGPRGAKPCPPYFPPPPSLRLGEGLGEGEQEESKIGEEEPELRWPKRPLGLRLGDLGTFIPPGAMRG